ncbi:STAS domain-containing protein [Haloferula sp. BvORR071]|uniref:STAS domain-containing protein n=1 Tax=Haloferula sp. BvORR071 TaxID=1396141 RepID=UPI00055667CA|nr:STAS domain-containing protein [Haloferula sp. BvORR071]
MEFTTEDIGGVAVARLKGVLDSAGVMRMQENVESQLIGRERKVVLDFSEIDALDPMGLAELLRLSRWIKEGGFRLRVAHAAGHVEEAFRDNMISDVEFFRDVNSATKYTVDAPPPRPVDPTPPPPPPTPKPQRPGFIKRYWWLLAAVVVLAGLGVGGMMLFSGKTLSKKVEFLTESGQPWSDKVSESLKPGEEKTLRFKVKNAGQILPIRNEDWIEMKVQDGPDKETKEVVYHFAPDKDFPSTDTFFYVTAGDGKPRVKSPMIYLTSDVKAVLPKFVTEGRDYEKSQDGKEGFLLAAGIEGEQYGPDGIAAIGGAKIQYAASGHEKYGLKFDTITGRFSGEAQSATPDGGYVEVTISAKNDAGADSVKALLFIEKKKVTETKTQAVNVFGEEIDKRFRLIDITSLERENIALLFAYKDAILKQGEGDIHKVGTVFFPKGETRLSVEFQRRLDSEFEAERFRELAKNPGTYFFVLGFADKGKTTDALNKRLIQERADKLRDYLAQHLTDRYKLSAEELKQRVRVIPMLPVPDGSTGQPVIFESRERSRAGEIWLVKDPRSK